jgi:hypothetical protein
VRLGATRRLVEGRWVAASPNTAMASALIRAARTANAEKLQERRNCAERPRQMLLSDFGVMPEITFTKKSRRRP